MEVRYFKHYSANLNRDMEFKVYGSCGKPVLFFPCQGGRFFDFEGNHMPETWSPWIESGKCTVYCADSIDNEAWAALGADNRWRIENHERWYHYIADELVPYIRHLSGARNGYDQGIMTFGCSMGAMHAANLYYRRPDLFDGCFAISGLYDNKAFFGDYCDDLVYNNCPVLYLNNMPADHPYMGLYNSQKSLIVVGQGAWEDVLLESTRRLDEVCCRKGIHTRFEYWGRDVNHDWPWWHKMVKTYLPWLLG
uniref:esterase family protein n=1 Tax=Faecousia sp. TaxID=2952921 RepID=UPI00402797BD